MIRFRQSGGDRGEFLLRTKQAGQERTRTRAVSSGKYLHLQSSPVMDYTVREVCTVRLETVRQYGEHLQSRAGLDSRK